MFRDRILAQSSYTYLNWRCYNQRKMLQKYFARKMGALIIVLSVLSGFMFGVAGPVKPKTLSVPAPSSVRRFVETGLMQHLAVLKSQNQKTYPLWSKSETTTFFLFSQQNYFVSGMFYAQLSMLSDITGAKFKIGSKPRLLGIFAERLKSWQDVNAFLSTQNTSFQIPTSAFVNKFTGCNAIRSSDDGAYQFAAVIINITDTKDFGQIDNCMFKALMDVFGFDTQALSNNLILEYSILHIMYNLDKAERDTSRIENEIIRRMPAE